MILQLSGPFLVAYLRATPTSDDRRAAADEIERLRKAVASALVACERVNRVVDGVDFPALAKGLNVALSGEAND